MPAAADDDHVKGVFHGGQIMMARPVNSTRNASSDRPRVLLDMRPLQGPSAGRGVGSYARGLLKGLIAQGFDSRLTLLLDAGLDEPALPPGAYRLPPPPRPRARP